MIPADFAELRHALALTKVDYLTAYQSAGTDPRAWSELDRALVGDEFHEQLKTLATIDGEELDEDRVSKQLLILGSCGSGKTYASKCALLRLLYNLGQTVADGVLWTWDVVFYDINEEFRKVGSFPVLDGRENPLYPFRRYTDAMEAIESARPHTIVVLEELLTVQRSYFPRIREWSARRRHHKHIVFGTTQRARNIPVELLSLANYIALFNLTHAGDLKHLSNVATFDPVEVAARQQGEFSLHKTM